jgi:hypothetical protein
LSSCRQGTGKIRGIEGLKENEGLLLRQFLSRFETKLNAVLGQAAKTNRGGVDDHKIIELCARNKFIVIFFTLAAMVGAVYCIKNMPLDAIPDLSDTQVIIYSQWDRSPDIIEQQVTYPIVTAMLGAPKVKASRGFSDVGFA